jgi:allantoinase
MKGMEAGRFDLAWGGIAGLSVALPVIYTECLRRGFRLEEIARWMSSAPAALAGIGAKAGALAAGRDANFVIFDTEASFDVAAERLHFRHGISPYVGETLRSVVKATYLRGVAVYRDGEFASSPMGCEVTLS